VRFTDFFQCCWIPVSAARETKVHWRQFVLVQRSRRHGFTRWLFLVDAGQFVLEALL
jgi:hypothetical protein